MTLTAKTRLLGCDLETFGLNPEWDDIIEVGLRLTDLDLNAAADDFHAFVWTRDHDIALERLRTSARRGVPGAQIVLDMHTESGLFAEAQANGLPYDEVSFLLVEWLTEHGIAGDDPLLGSSVHFDKRFLEWYMEEPANLLFRRNIDISSVKELVVRYRPDLYERLNREVPLRKLHRVLPDLDDTFAEHKFYLDNFLKVTP